MKKAVQRQGGFTVLELLVVLVLAGILIALAIFMFGK